jgi:hypothetical protein
MIVDYEGYPGKRFNSLAGMIYMNNNIINLISIQVAWRDSAINKYIRFHVRI